MALSVACVGVLWQVLVKAVELGQGRALADPGRAARTGCRQVQISAQGPQRVAAVAILWQRWWRQVIVCREVLRRRREVALNVEAAGIVVGVDGTRVTVQRGGRLHNLILWKLLDSRKLNTWHPIRCVPVISCLIRRTHSLVFCTEAQSITYSTIINVHQMASC